MESTENKKLYTITLSDGSVIENLRLNGDNYISGKVLSSDMFAGNCSTVSISSEDGEEIHSNMELIHLTQYGDEYWFSLREQTEAEIRERTLIALADSLIAARPEAEKKGYQLTPVFLGDNGTIGWEYVADSSAKAKGSYLSPIEWVPGMEIQAGVNSDYESDGWYIYNGLVQRCIKSGAPTSFTDSEYWEIFG
jgi:hypothetical protein